jgi:hypothetical protein
LTILILSRNVRQGSAAKSTSRGGKGIVAWFFKEGLAQKKRVVCKTASGKTQPVVGWTFRKAVVQAQLSLAELFSAVAERIHMECCLSV